MNLYLKNEFKPIPDSSNWYERYGDRKIEINSSLDKTPQTSIFFRSDSTSPTPLLISLHTWTNTAIGQDSTSRLNWCRRNKWNFIQPDYRGENKKPAAMGSELAVQDVVDAVNYAKAHASVDSDRIYVVGASGGGHMALLLAGRHPEIWAGVSAWCPISDIKAWYYFLSPRKSGYAQDIIQCAGGNPDSDPQALAACVKRSPVTYLANSTGVNLDIATGIHDGHTGSVPVSHAFNAFNAVATPLDIIVKTDIDSICLNRAVPEHMKSRWDDKTYTREILYRKISGNSRLTIFEGGHEEVESASLSWLSQQHRNRPAVWSIPLMDSSVGTVQVLK